MVVQAVDKEGLSRRVAVGLERGRDWRPQGLEARWARGEAWRLRKGPSELIALQADSQLAEMLECPRTNQP